MAYIIQVTVFSALLFAVYLCFLRGSKAYGWGRAYLMLCVCLPPLLPLFKVEGISGKGGGMPQVVMPVVEVIAGMKTATILSATTLWLLYGIVATIMFVHFLVQYITCLGFLRRMPYRQINDARLITGCCRGPGSFGNYIFFADNDLQEDALRHELAHVKLRHTADVLLLRLLQCAFWPNVVLYLIQRELRAIHEFQADAQAAGNKEEYARLLLCSLFHTAQFPLSHTFFNHPIKRRIIMLQKKPLSRTKLRTTVAGAVLSSLFVISSVVYLQSCTPKPNEAKTEVNVAGANNVVAARPSIDLGTFLSENLQYPQQAKENKIEGKVLVSFTIDEQGNVQKPTIKKSPDEHLSAEALRVINLLPRWAPATKNGKPVASELCLPIAFKLQ